jgi:hypothetical protein
MKKTSLLLAVWGLMLSGSRFPAFAQVSESCTSINMREINEPIRTLLDAEQAAVGSTTDRHADSPAFNFKPRAAQAGLSSDIYKPESEHYAATIEIIHLSWPRLLDGRSDNLGARLSLGISSPHYSIKEELRMMGSVDFKIEGIYHGLINSARLTLVYDMRRSLKGNDTRMSLTVNRVVFKVGVPVGRW